MTGPRSAVRELDAACEPFAEAATRRLTQALALLEAEPVAAQVADGPARRDEARALYPRAARPHLGAKIAPEIARLARARLVVVGTLRAHEAGKDPKNEPLINAVLRAGADLHERLQEFRRKVGDGIDYPFRACRRKRHAMAQVRLPFFPARKE